jgi:hypothetical protein
LEYSDGSYDIIAVQLSMISGYDASKIGIQTLTVTYQGKTANFDINVIPVSISNEHKTVTVDLTDTLLPSGVSSVTLFGEVISDSGSDANDYTTVRDLLRSNTNLGDLQGLVIYGLELLDQNGNPVDSFNGKIKVKVLIPADMRNSSNLHMFWYDPDNGTLTDMNATVEGDYLVFETTHFSSYAIAGLSENTTSETPASPETGDNGSTEFCLWMSIFLALLITEGLLKGKRKKYLHFKKS